MLNNRLHIDIETFCEQDITKCGVYRYASDPSFEILLVAYAYDDDPVEYIDLASGDKMPNEFLRSLFDPDITKCAHNATFERVCFSNWLRRHGCLFRDEWLDPKQWECSMIMAYMCGLPGSLKGAGEALHFDKQKMAEGKELIKLFCQPQKVTKKQPNTRALPVFYPEQWHTFKNYCIRDVEVEREIFHALEWLSNEEWKNYAYDQRINDRGVLIDRKLAENAQAMDEENKAELTQRLQALMCTDAKKPGSVKVLKDWLEQQTGDSYGSLSKQAVGDLAKDTDSDLVKDVCKLRLMLGKTSNAKYTAMLNTMCGDDRVRGTLQFYGARTGRWAGRLVQLQNLPQNHLDTLDWARKRLKANDRESLELMYGDVPDTLSQLIRTALIAPSGKTFAVCDYSAIEARLLAWLAGEEWALQAFRLGRDIYCETASKMFEVPVEKHGQNAHLRKKGKVAVLGLGYGGSVGALKNMGADRMGLSDDELQEIVKKWRASNPHIVAFWKRIENAARACISTGSDATVQMPGSPAVITFRMEQQGRWMTIELPSGRKICYYEIMLGQGPDSGRTNVISYMGTNQKTGRWSRIETHGGKLVENITQAVGRDCLMRAVSRCEDNNYPIVFSVHDEVIIEVENEDALSVIQGYFAEDPSWAPGLPLNGAGYCTKYYMKD